MELGSLIGTLAGASRVVAVTIPGKIPERVSQSEATHVVCVALPTKEGETPYLTLMNSAGDERRTYFLYDLNYASRTDIRIYGRNSGKEYLLLWLKLDTE